MTHHFADEKCGKIKLDMLGLALKDKAGVASL